MLALLIFFGYNNASDDFKDDSDFIRGVAQLVERRSPKPKVAGSIPAAPAN